MIRLHITAEGQTELNFAKKVLAPHLAQFNVFVYPRSVLTSKDKRTATEFRGGLLSYHRAKNDIQMWIKECGKAECRFTTMFDLYGLPRDFPAYAVAIQNKDPYERVRLLEEGLERDIGDERFFSYIQLHEFEALILASPQTLDWEYLEHETPIANLVSMVGEQNPELINDGIETAPSKRILKQIPEYDKVTAGVAITKEIGLQMLRKKCSHFGDSLSRLEKLAEIGL